MFEMRRAGACSVRSVASMDTTSASELQNSLISICVADIPSYLRQSEFFRSLNIDEDLGIVEIPIRCFKLNNSITDKDEFIQMIHTIVYWQLDEFPFSVLDFWRDNVQVHDDLIAQFPDHCNIQGDLPQFKDGTMGIIWAVKSNRSEMLRYWYQLYPPGSGTEADQAIDNAAYCGDLQLIMGLHSGKYPMYVDACHNAARQGHLQCLKYLRENGCEWDDDVCLRAAIEGRLECLKYLCENECFPHKDYMPHVADLACLKLLREFGCSWDEELFCFTAACQGKLDFLQYGHENGCRINESMSHVPYLACVEYALQHGCPISDSALFYLAYEVKPYEILLYLRERGAMWDNRVTSAALKCPVKYLMYMISNGCPYEYEIVFQTARKNLVDHMRYLVEEVLVSMNADVFTVAFMCGSVECVNYLVDAGCHCVFSSHYLSLSPAYGATPDDAQLLQCLQYTTEHGWPCNASMQVFLLNYINRQSCKHDIEDNALWEAVYCLCH